MRRMPAPQPVLLLLLIAQRQPSSAAPAALSAAPAPQLRLSCGQAGGCNESFPLQGNIAQATVTFGKVTAPPPLWVRLDRCDHVDDNTIWLEYFPRWAPAAEGTFDFQWLAGTNSSSISVKASGWSARYNGTQLTGNSTCETVFFSFDYRSTTTLLEVEDTGPGAVRLSGKPGLGLNATEGGHWVDTCDFSAYAVGEPVKGALNFKPSFGLHQTAGSKCAISLAFADGGVYYHAIQGGRTGLSQSTSSACIHWGQECAHPLALVVPFFNGSIPALPHGFLGPVHHVSPLKTPHQFCIEGGIVSTSANKTAFAGSQLKIPMCQVIGQSIPPRPQFASFLAPAWLTILPKHNDTDPSYTVATLNSSRRIPAGAGPAAGNSEPRLQQTFDGGGRWEVYNDYVRVYLSFAPEHVGKTVELYVLLHNDADELAAVEAEPSKWQVLSIELVALPDLRPLLGWHGNNTATTLMTALTWTDAGLFFNGTTSDGSFSYLETYARLGFNTVPGIYRQCPHGDWRCVSPWNPTPPSWAHPPGALADEFSYPGNRTGSSWNGLKFGNEGPEFGRLYGMTHLPLNASLLPMWAPGVSDPATEMLKWQRARNFTAAHSMVDMAYDGAFFRADVADFCAAVKSSRPEWIFTDDEGFAGSWGYSLHGALSKNAQARRLPGESDFDLTWRMVSEFLQVWSECLDDLPSKAGTRTMIGFYGTTFEPGQFMPAGFVPMPSEYGAIKDIRNFAANVRKYRSQMVHSPVPDKLGPAGQLTESRQLMPVLTACTYGQMEPVDVFNGALHAFAGGASGFNFFAGNCFDDPGKILALSTAAGLAAPFAAHFLRGLTISAPDQLTIGKGVLSAAGMRSGLDCWLVITPVHTASSVAPVEMELLLTLPFDGAGNLAACELLSGKHYSFAISGNSASISLHAAGTVVLHLTSGDSPTGGSSPTCAPTTLWFPRGLAGAISPPTSGTRPRVAVPVKSDDDEIALSSSAFYRFEEQSNLGVDTAGNSPLSQTFPPATSGPPFRWQPQEHGGIVGGFVDFGGQDDSSGPTLSGVSTVFVEQVTAAAPGGAPLPGFTFEALFRTGYNFNREGNTTLFRLNGTTGSVAELTLERHSITFRVDTSNATGVSTNCLEVPLDQIGRRSMFYLTDGAWHHIAATIDLSAAVLRIWLDGESPDDSVNINPGNAPAQPGQPGRGFSAAIAHPSGALVHLGGAKFHLLPTPFSGGLDEVALHNSSITAQQAFAHYTRAMHHVQYGNTTLVAPPAPPPASTVGVLDPKEFAPGTICPGWVHNCTPLVECSNPGVVYLNGSTPGAPDQPTTVQQLSSYPLPRFNAAALALGLFPWNTCWATRYLGGSPSIGQPYPSKCGSNCSKMYNGVEVTAPPYYVVCKVRNRTCETAQSALEWNAIQLELGTHWRQPIYIDSSNLTIQLANAHPEIPLATIISRGGDTILWNTTKQGPGFKNMSTDTASRKCFVQNAAGNLLSVDGVPLNMNTLIKPHQYASHGMFRPCVTAECAAEADCPLKYLYENDGAGWVQQFREYATNGLKRPINRLYDDGEIMGTWHMLNHALDQDPVMIADYTRVGIPLLAGGQRDWEAYTSKWRTMNTLGFRDLFIADPSLPTMNAEYSEYDVAGTTLFGGFNAWATCATGDWNYTRAISHEVKTGIPGTASHYFATPSIYPWDPSGRTCGQGGNHQVPVGQQALWDAGKGSWAGLDLLMYTRPSEIANGDHYFMPFLSAGWTEREEMSLRPAQLLGLLKITMVMGASYFNPFTGMYTARPENWAWQAVLHTYAQAVASQVSDLFWNSTLMEPESYPVPPRACYVLSSPSQHSPAKEASCSQNYDGTCGFSYVWTAGDQSTCFDPRWPPVNYRFWAGDQSVVVVVRQQGKSPRQGGNVGKYLIGTTVQPQSNMVGNAPLSLNISFMLNGHNISLETRRQGSVYVLNNESGDPVLTQLDRWHEASHPSWWSQDFHFEAEAHHVAPMADPTQPRPIAANAPTVHTARESTGETRGLYDFVGSSSYIRLAGEAVAEFRFQPRAPDGRHVVHYQVEAAGRGSGCVSIDVTPTSDLGQKRPRQQLQHQLLCFTPGAMVARGGYNVISVMAGVDHSIQLRATDPSRNVDVDWVRLVHVGL